MADTLSIKPDLSYIDRILQYNNDTGDLIWKYREDRGKTWNTRFSGCVAGAINQPSKKKQYKRRVLNIDGQMIKAHHIVWILNTGAWPSQEIDHIDRNPLNNRFDNLRLSDRFEQSENSKMRSDNKSGVTGVFFDKVAKKWRAEIFSNGKNKFLGYGPTIEYCSNLRVEFIKNKGSKETS